ncbi:phosphatidate cytidylyltransferase [Pelagibacteraceae bacterium]|nr:phosphatidate cytidylyltransferase [Pelagibacteraceae bacterium]
MKNNTNKLVIYIFKLAVIFTFFSFLILQITTPIFKILFIKIIVIIWLFDTFSYLGGKIIGGKKLFPKVSSGKTISGLISGVVLTFFLVNITESYIPYLSDTSILFIIFIIISAFFGDMIASLVKRNADVKDSGTIMPGHGGLLDRMDSFIGVFFVFNIFQIIFAL